MQYRSQQSMWSTDDGLVARSRAQRVRTKVARGIGLLMAAVVIPAILCLVLPGLLVGMLGLAWKSSLWAGGVWTSLAVAGAWLIAPAWAMMLVDIKRIMIPDAWRAFVANEDL